MEYSLHLVRAYGEPPLFSPEYQALMRVLAWFARPDVDLGNRRQGFVHGWTGEFGYESRTGLVTALQAIGKLYLEGRMGRSVVIRDKASETTVVNVAELDAALGQIYCS